MAVIFIDVDSFKEINDTYGHDVGDEVLKMVASKLIDSIRQTDIAARWGGEEFMILLPETSSPYSVAELIRSNIAKYNFESIPKSVTVSVGIAVFNKDIDTKDTIIKNVDIALYKAKHSGKNMVIDYDKMKEN